MSYRKGSRKSHHHFAAQPAPPPPPPPQARAYSPSPPRSVRSYGRPASVVLSPRPYSPYAEPAYEEEALAPGSPLSIRYPSPVPKMDSPSHSEARHSDHSWAVEPGPPPITLHAALRSAPPSAAPSPRGSIIGYPPSRAPSVAPPASEGARYPVPPAPEMETFSPPPVDVEATSVEHLISKDLGCFRQYHALRVAVEGLSRADCSLVGPVVPEVIVFGRAAQVVGALTGVELISRPLSLSVRPITWDVGLRDGRPVNLSSIEDHLRAAIRHDVQEGIRLNIAKDGVADLIVHEVPDDTMLPGAYHDRGCAIIAVRHGNGDVPLSMPFCGSNPIGQRTIFIGDSAEPDAWKAELSKLDAILSSILRSRISTTIASLTSRIDDVRKDLKALPAAQVDPMSQLMSLVAQFSGDIFGIGATRVSEDNFLQQIRDEYRSLSRDIKNTIPHFGPAPPCPPSPPFAPRGIHVSSSDWPFAMHSPNCSRPVSVAPSQRPGSAHSLWGHLGPQQGAANGVPPPGGLAPAGVECAPSNNVTFGNVSTRLQLLTRGELLGQFPVDKLCRALIDECTSLWANIVERRVQSVAQIVVHRASERIQWVFGPYHDSGLPEKISDIMRERIRSALRAAKVAISTLVTMETSVNVPDEEAFLTAKERWERQYSRDFQQPPSPSRVQSLTRAVTLDVMATVSAYLEIAHQRFVDGINRAVNAHVIYALDQDIAPAIMGALKQREPGKWLEPSSEVASGRAALQERLEALVRAREEVMLSALA